MYMRNIISNLGKIKSFICLYIVVIIAFLLIPLFPFDWVSGSYTHMCFEIISSLIALTAATSIFIYFFGTGSRYYLIIGIGFFIVGGESLVHGILSCDHFINSTISTSDFVPMTYVFGKILLALSFILAPILDRTVEMEDRRSEALITAAIALFLSISLTTLAFILPIPQFTYPASCISRPADFVATLLFLISLFLIGKTFILKKDPFSGLLIASILFNIGGSIYMSISKQLYDGYSDIAHISGIASYLMPLLGIGFYGLSEIYKGRKLLEACLITESELYKSEEYLKTLFDQSPVSVEVYHPNGDLKVLNASAKRMFDIRDKDIEKYNVFRDKKLEDIGVYPRLHEVLLGEKISLPEVHCEIDNINRWLSSTAYPLKINDKIDSIVVIHEDITKRKKAEEERNHIQAKLGYAQKLASLGEMAAALAHEINNPITSIVTSNELVLDDVEEGSEGHILLSNSIEQCMRIQRITDGLLKFTRQDSEKCEVKIIDLISDSMTFLEQALKSEGIDLDVSLDEFDISVMGCKETLQQVIVNLINNARNALCKAAKKHITILISRYEDKVKIAFKDTGKGIPPEKVNNVFDPFWTTRRDEGGSGLGLSVSYSIIKDHKGTISVESKEGEWTEFTILIPIYKGIKNG